MNRSLLNLISPPLKVLARSAKGPWDTRAIQALAGDPHAEVARMGQALRAALAGDVPEADRPHLARVEARRGAWLADTRPFLRPEDAAEDGAFDRGYSVRDVALASKDARRAGLLYQLTRHRRPRVAIELGSNLGVSAAYQALGMRRDGGDLAFHLFDRSVPRLREARDLHATLPLPFLHDHPGAFQDTLAVTLASMPPVDYAFVDGHHQYEPSRAYTDLILRHASAGALIVFDDIRWNAGMRRFWKEIQSDVRFSLVVDLLTLGFALKADTPVPGRPRLVGPLLSFL